ADWYALGTVLFEALTGRPPFDGSGVDVMMEKQSAEAPTARSVAPDVAPDLDTLCRALLRRNPAERPSGKEVLERLGAGPQARPQRVETQPFVGRERELTQLFDAHRASRQAGVTVFVQGESGVGKSALVRRFLDSLNDATAVVLAG